jgi:hypothetical protein
MTEMTQYRLSLALAIFGALTVLAHSWGNLVMANRINLPTFVQSAPDVHEWPVHQYLPIG